MVLLNGIPFVSELYAYTHMYDTHSLTLQVSWIQSLYSGFGSGLVDRRLGFAFQSRGALFSMDRNAANAFAPRKRPYHTIMPSFVMRDGKPFMSFGVMGGFMQPQGCAQVRVYELSLQWVLSVRTGSDCCCFCCLCQRVHPISALRLGLVRASPTGAVQHRGLWNERRGGG